MAPVRPELRETQAELMRPPCYPIATGQIEGACRHLVRDRMDITGARWSLEGAEAMLRVRSLMKSDDWDEYCRFHFRQEHARAYPPIKKAA